jgi:F0F1-type ATP synthase delta subunit
MKDETLLIESNVELAKSFVDSIAELIGGKFGLKFSVINAQVNSKLIGGILVSFADYKILLTEDLQNMSSEVIAQKLIIESSRQLSDQEKSSYVQFAKTKLNLSTDIKVESIINSKIIGGIKIRYQDEELDLTIDNILDQAFSKI